MSRRVAYRSLVVTPMVLALAGCDVLSPKKTPAMELKSSAPGVTVGQSGSAAVTLSVARTNFSNTVTLAVDGAPAGVVATISPAVLDNTVNSAQLNITAAGTAVPGSSVLTVRATGDGIAERTLSIDLTITATGSFALGFLEPSVTVAQGGGGSATILVSRFNNNAGNVTLTASGVPAGVTAAISSSPTTASSARIDFTADGTAATGSYAVSLAASSPGFPDQSASFTLVVSAPPPTAALTIPFCANDLPAWFAYRNEGYRWQRLLPTGNAFTFNATDRVTVAFVFPNTTRTQFNVFSSTRAELAASNDRDCAGATNLSGSVTGLGAGQSARIVMGAKSASVTTSGGTYALANVNDRPLDLVATRGTVSGTYFTPDRMIVRRSLDSTSGATIPVLDFAGAESFAPAATTLTLTGIQTADQVEMQNTFWTATATFGVAQTALVTGGAATLYSAPAGVQIAGDLHELYVDAFTQTSSSIIGHSYVAYYGAPANRTDALGPVLGTPTVNTVAVTPYARMRGRITSQPEYDTSIRFGYFQQPATGPGRLIVVAVSAAYLGGRPATWDVVIPDFGSIAGFNESWMLAPNQPTNYFVEPFSGRTDLLFGAQPAVGDAVRFAYRVERIFTSQLRAAVVRDGLPQYLRR